VLAVIAVTAAIILVTRGSNTPSSTTSTLAQTTTAPATTATPTTTAAASPPPTTTTTTTAVRPVDDAELPGLLLPPEELTALLGVTLTPMAAAPGIADDAASVTPTACVSALIAVQRAAYDNSGFRSGFAQQFQADPRAGSAAQAVVSFPTPELAAAFIDREEQLWQPCAHTTLTVYGVSGAPNRAYQLGAPVNADGILSLTSTRDDRPLECQHAITARGNVVAEATACLVPTVTEHARTIVAAIADRIGR
jgi:hypothetical protein